MSVRPTRMALGKLNFADAPPKRPPLQYMLPKSQPRCREALRTKATEVLPSRVSSRSTPFSAALERHSLTLRGPCSQL